MHVLYSSFLTAAKVFESLEMRKAIAVVQNQLNSGSFAVEGVLKMAAYSGKVMKGAMIAMLDQMSLLIWKQHLLWVLCLVE